jgi:hypothetical protein
MAERRYVGPMQGSGRACLPSTGNGPRTHRPRLSRKAGWNKSLPTGISSTSSELIVRQDDILVSETRLRWETVSRIP